MESVYVKLSRDLLQAPETKSILRDLKKSLDAKASKAEIHRILSEEGLFQGSISTFRKQYTNSSDWIKDSIRIYNLDGVMKLLNIDDAFVRDQLQKLKRMHDDIEKPMPIVGKPLINTSRPFKITD